MDVTKWQECIAKIEREKALCPSDVTIPQEITRLENHQQITLWPTNQEAWGWGSDKWRQQFHVIKNWLSQPADPPKGITLMTYTWKDYRQVAHLWPMNRDTYTWTTTENWSKRLEDIERFLDAPALLFRLGISRHDRELYSSELWWPKTHEQIQWTKNHSRFLTFKDNLKKAKQEALIASSTIN